MTAKQTPEAEAPFISHLVELRDRILRMVLAILIVFIGLFPFANDIYTFIAGPLMAVLPEGTSMIATQVASPFLTPFKLSLVAAVFLTMPYLLHQLWAFVAPGLYRHERRLALPLLASSIFLFYAGVAFAYFVVFPLVFAFLTSVAPEGVAVMTDIAAYLDFVLTLFFAFGFAFEIPIATILLVWAGMTTPEALRRKRPYVIVGAFVAGMLLTPPDVISQTLLALPMWVLFELGLIFAKIFARKGATDEDESPGDDDAEAAGEPESPPEPPSGPSSGARPAAAGEAVRAPAAAGAPVASVDGDPPESWDDGRFVPMSEAEMDAELDRIEAEEADEEAEFERRVAAANAEAVAAGVADSETNAPEVAAPEAEAPAPEPPAAEDRVARVDAKLQRVQELREALDFDGMRRLLYEVLVEGDDSQVSVARNILAQLDEPPA
jgi:sec-independent protein translocase protein TatC